MRNCREGGAVEACDRSFPGVCRPHSSSDPPSAGHLPPGGRLGASALLLIPDSSLLISDFLTLEVISMGKGSRVKGIIIEIGGETAKLDKALQGTNKHIGDTQKQLKDVERLLKLDPKNTVLLQQKQKLLAQAVGDTEDKLRTLTTANKQAIASAKNYDAWQAAYKPLQDEIDKTGRELAKMEKAQREALKAGQADTDEYNKLQEEIAETYKRLKELKQQSEAVYDQFGRPISPEQFDSLQREIIETEQELKDLKTSAERNLDALGDACGGAERKLERLGDTVAQVKTKADGIADAFRPVTNAVVGMAGAAMATVPATEELREDLSRLDANALENAVSAEAARKAWKAFAVQSGETDSAVEAVSNLLQAGFTESNLQKAVENLAGAAQRFPDTLKVESLADSLQETLATGKGTGQFAELLERLGLDLEAFDAELAACATQAQRQDLALQTLANAGLADSYRAYQAANAEMVKNKEANLELQLTIAELAETVMPMVTEGIQALTEFLQWFNALPGPIKGVIAAVALLAASIAPAAQTVSGFSVILGKFAEGDLPGLGTALSSIGTKAIPALTGAVGKGFGWITGTALPGLSGAFSSVFGFIASNPIVLLIAAIAGLVALVAAKGDEAQAGLQKLDDWLQGVFAKDWTEVFGPTLGGVLNGFMDVFKGIWDAMKKNLDGVIDFIRGVFTGDWERAWKGVVELFESVFDGFVAIFKTPLNGVIAMTNKAIAGMNWLIEKANNIPGVDIGWRIPEIPMLAKGGQVLQGSAIVGEAGPELLTVTGGRTIVQPLGGNSYHRNTSLGGVVLNVYAAPGQDPEEIADMALDKLQHQYEMEDGKW